MLKQKIVLRNDFYRVLKIILCWVRENKLSQFSLILQYLIFARTFVHVKIFANKVQASKAFIN